MAIFKGAGVAIVTPMKDNQDVNYDKLEELINQQIDAGTDAIVIAGTTGESSTLTMEEHRDVIKAAVEFTKHRVPVVAGTGSNCTRTAIQLSQEAEEDGVDGLLIVTPYYNKATQAGLVRHYTAIADAVTKPVILYDVPSRTGVTIAPETYAQLSRHPNINGVKEAGGNLSSIQKTRNLCPDDFSIWSGNDDETAAICLLGGKGVISVVANVAPDRMHQLVRLCLVGDFAAAGKLQLELKELCDALFCEVNPIPVKTALNLMGMEAGDLRLPLCEPSEANLERIRRTLVKYGLLEN